MVEPKSFNGGTISNNSTTLLPIKLCLFVLTDIKTLKIMVKNNQDVTSAVRHALNRVLRETLCVFLQALSKRKMENVNYSQPLSSDRLKTENLILNGKCKIKKKGY